MHHDEMTARVRTRFTPEEIRRNVELGRWRTDVVTDHLFAIAERDPDREAIVDRAARVTYGRLADMVRRVARSLTELGIGVGDRVTLQLPNWHECLIVHFALERIGAVSVPMPPIYRAKEVGFILKLTQAKCAFIAPQLRGFDFRAMYEELWAQAPALEHVVLVGDSSPSASVSASASTNERVLSFSRLLEPRDPDAPLTHTPDPNVLCEIAFTSGSTGDPKGVMHTSNTLWGPDELLGEVCRLTEKDVMFIPSTIGHQLGYSLGVRMPILNGCKVVFLDHWDPVAAVELIAREGVTYLLSTPTFLMDLVAAPNREAHTLPSLRAWVLAGAVVPTALVEEVKVKIPHLQLGFTFGMTEMGGMIANAPGGPADKGTSVGLPGKNVEVKVFGPDGQEVGVGEDGELAMRTPALFIGYYKRPDLTDGCLTDDNFFLTGDQVRRDADGYIYVTGRIKDLIKRGGENISPVEIEEIVYRHPSVADVAIVGLPDARLGERICAVVVLKSGATLTLDELVRWVAESGAAKQKYPERLELVAALPMTPVGKVHKALLRKQLSA